MFEYGWLVECLGQWLLLSTKSICPLDFIDGANTVIHDVVGIPSGGKVIIARI